MRVKVPDTADAVTIPFQREAYDRAALKIAEYVKKHPGCLTSEITKVLKIDPLLTVRILADLESKGKVRSEELG